MEFAPVRMSVALISTVLNEAHSIRQLMDSVTAQTRPPDELIIVDGGSTDDTLKVLMGWAPPSGTRYAVLVEPGMNIAAGRNLAIAHATSDIVAVTDGGTTLDARWLEELATAIEDGGDIAAGFFYPTGSTFTERLIAAVITPLESEIDPSTFLPSSRSVAFRKKSLESVGGYPTWIDFCEDLLLDRALIDSGATIKFVPSALVSWSGRPTIRAFCKQYYRYARGDGKAGLWPKRHAARYSAYTTWLLLLRRPRSRYKLALGFATFFYYHSKYVRRVINRPDLFQGSSCRAAMLAPGVALVGDLSKMVGYPIGIAWRRRTKSPSRDERVMR